MQEYKLEIKQSVNYPRCRIYRDFVQNLIADTGIRVNGENLLFHYTVLCSYANFRTSYRRVCGITYTIYPGEWVAAHEVCQFSNGLQHDLLKDHVPNEMDGTLTATGFVIGASKESHPS